MDCSGAHGRISRGRPCASPHSTQGLEAEQIRLPADHLRGWKPIRPLGLAFDRVHAGPGEPFPHYADSVTQCLATTENQIEVGVRGVDYDCVRDLVGRIFDHLAAQVRRDFRAPYAICSPRSGRTCWNIVAG